MPRRVLELKISRQYLQGFFQGAKADLTSFYQTHTVTATLAAAFVTSLLLLPVAYLIRLVFWSVSLLTFVLYYMTSVLSAVISWVMVQIVSFSLFLLPLSYPATVVAVTGNWIGKCFKLNNREFFQWIQPFWAQFLTKLTLSVVIGQLMLRALPPMVTLITKRVETSPLVLITFIVIILIMFIVIYYGVILGLNINDLSNKVLTPVTTVTDEDINTCCVCLVNPKNILIQPCRHFGVCKDCIQQLRECPSCRSVIESHQEIFPQ